MSFNSSIHFQSNGQSEEQPQNSVSPFDNSSNILANNSSLPRDSNGPQRETSQFGAQSQSQSLSGNPSSSSAGFDLLKAFFLLNDVGEYPAKYNFMSATNASRPFWKEVVDSKKFPEFGTYSGETLRSYYRTLKETNNFPQLWRAANENKTFIQISNMKYTLKQTLKPN